MAGLTTFLARTGYHGGMDVIYADELVALNALIDYLLLLLAARAAELPLRRGRFALAGLAGGLYALAAAVGPGVLRTGAGKLLLSGLMCALAFGCRRGVWKGWGAFLGLSALFAGAVYAAALLSGRPAGPGSVPAAISARLLAVCFALCWAAVRLLLERSPPGSARAEVVLTLGERSVRLTALRDTGNRLRDPVSGCAVLTADGRAMGALLGDALPLPVPEDPTVLLRCLARDPRLAPRLGLAPYAAVGGTGLLVTVRPDSVTVDGQDVRALAAVSPVGIGDGDYNAIL